MGRVVYPLQDQVTEILESDATPVEKLERCIYMSVRSAARLQTYYGVLLSDQTALSPQSRKQFRVWFHEIDRTIEHLLQDCVVDGDVRDDIDLNVATKLLNTMLTGVHRWYQPSGALAPEAVADEAMKFLSGFILAPTGRRPPRLTDGAKLAGR